VLVGSSSPLPELMPLAIQTRKDGPVTMPGDGAEWEFAKLQVQVADVNLHEMGYHLWGTHFSMEAFAVAAARSLAITHPLRELLRRHFHGLLWINQYGLRHLINTGGDPRRPVQDFLAPSFSGSIETMRKSRDGWSIAKKALARDLRERGLDVAHSLTEYPYRDDGRLVWRAIENFIEEYVDRYYDSPQDVRDDEELTAFYEELAEHNVPDIGRPDHPDPARNLIDLKEQLVQILWVSTALHNVLNQPQWPIAAYAANAPSASNVDPAGPAPLSPTAVYLESTDPDDNTKQRTVGMMGLMGELALYNPDFAAGGLGHYRWWGRWKDDRVEPIVGRFQAALATVDATIVDRNRTRRLKYEWLRPSLMNNSTST
jgi:arachidonate 15-lipoxygenase